MEPADLGRAIQDLRTQKKIGLRELARMTEMSPASIVAIEKGASSPNLATLHKMLRALGSNFAEFFANSPEQTQLPFFPSQKMRSVSDEDRKYIFLFPKRADMKFEMVHETIAPAEKNSEWEEHDCDLGGVIISGGPASLEIQGQGQWTIRKNDSYYIKAASRHRLINLSKRPLKQITVMDPPRY